MSGDGGLEPVNRDPHWRYLPLTEDRTPLRGMTRARHPEYWAGAEVTWEGALEHARAGRALGLLTHANGLLVLDCDRKVTWEPGPDGVARQVARHGMDDLVRVAAEAGQPVPPTLAVATKSGGYHLIYRQRPGMGVPSRGHRDGWLIDVKASPNTWVVAPPSAGYRVVRDLPVAVLPAWLAGWLGALHRNTAPLGGERARHLIAGVHALALADLGGEGMPLLDRWVGANLALVRLANEHGGWNSRIYEVARQFLDVGMPPAEVEAVLMDAASPWDEAEAHAVRRTVASAVSGHGRAVAEAARAARFASGRPLRYPAFRDEV